MNGTSVDEDSQYQDTRRAADLDSDLGLRPESRTERRANRRKARARRGFGDFFGRLGSELLGGGTTARFTGHHSAQDRS